MGLNYNKRQDLHSQDSMWTSYADLFLGLSVIFLLLFVVASLRQGTDGIRQHFENKDLRKQIQDLQTQMSLYDNLRKDYLKNEANVDEQKSYELLMDKLSLLQEDAKDEKNKLRQQALDNEKKEVALNQYQQMIRNIINANILSKTKVKKRDVLITAKNEIISDQANEIESLESDMSSKQAELEKGERRISELESDLENKMKALRLSFKQQKISKEKYEKERKKMEELTATQIAELAEKNKEARQNIARVSAELEETRTSLAKVGQEKEKLAESLEDAKSRHQAEVSNLKSGFAAQQAAERAAFEKEMGKQRISAKQRAAEERAFRDRVAQKEKEFAGRIASLDKDLRKAQDRLNAQKNLAKQLKGNFAKAGVHAEVDEGTGDVILSFGEHYFDTGKARLKPEMEKILERAMPVYSKTLFEDKKISSKLQNVEIIGFASPTFRGKQVDPGRLSIEDKAAVDFNLDLSFERAKTIFNHVFDKKRMEFNYQDQLFPMVKVSGRSFLGQGNGKDYCSKNDCAKLQKVIIKFNLKD